MVFAVATTIKHESISESNVTRGCTAYILGTGSCHLDGYRFSGYWYKKQYQPSQVWYKGGTDFQDFGM